MDQLKTQLAVALKYGFWISSGIVLLGALFVWYSTTSTLASESVSQTSKIKGSISTVNSIEQELATTPNETSHQEMRSMIKDRQDLVLKSWSKLYEKQQDILTWPVDELTADFVSAFKPLIPIEAHVTYPTPVEQEKETTLLNQYRRYIKNVLPSIAAIAKAEWTTGFERSMGSPRNSADTGEIDITGIKKGPLVKWSSASQNDVLNDLFPWAGNQPTTLDVYYSQENIWILRQLLEIISTVNGAARQPYQAKIHEINSINIGKSVRFGAGDISTPGITSSGAMDLENMEMDMEGMEMAMAADTGFPISESSDPADLRYVNAALQPIAATALRAALTSESPDDAGLAVAKRIPVMLSLQMDQRAVHELIAACGSAKLMVDVNQVRLLPPGGSKRRTSGGGGGMTLGGGLDDEDDFEDDDGFNNMGQRTTSVRKDSQADEDFPLDMTIEIYGIILLYNPADRRQLALDKVTENTLIDGETETVGGTPVAPATPAAPAQSNDVLPTPQAEPAATAPAGSTPPAVNAGTPPPDTSS